MNRLSVYDPFADVFPELFRGLLQPARRNGEAPLEIKVDVKEAEKEYTVHADLPGVAKDDIQVDIDGNRVSITATVQRSSEQKEGERVLRSERYQGSVARSFALANEIDDAAAQAQYENGVLTLVLPKREAASKKRLSIA